MDFEFISHKIESNSNLILSTNEIGVVIKLHKSKLQICVEILCTLSSHGSMKLTEIDNAVELDNSLLEQHMSFLYERGLVGEQNLSEEEKDYFVTERGLSVLKVMGPLIREAQRIQVRNFEAISSAISVVPFNSGKVEEKKSRWKLSIPKWRLSDLIKIEIEEAKE